MNEMIIHKHFRNSFLELMCEGSAVQSQRFPVIGTNAGWEWEIRFFNHIHCIEVLKQLS